MKDGETQASAAMSEVVSVKAAYKEKKHQLRETEQHLTQARTEIALQTAKYQQVTLSLKFIFSHNYLNPLSTRSFTCDNIPNAHDSRSCGRNTKSASARPCESRSSRRISSNPRLRIQQSFDIAFFTNCIRIEVISEARP